MTFGGGGPRLCLGANLGRREIPTLFEELLSRVGEIELIGEPVYASLGIHDPILVALTNVPVRPSPAPG